MDKNKHQLLFDYFGQKEEVMVDDFFVFNVLYFNKNNCRDTVKQSERVIVPLGVTEIHLIEKDGKDTLIYKWNDKLVDVTNDIEGFLKTQYREVTLKKLFYAIRDNCDGMTTRVRLMDIAEDYSNVIF